MERTEYNANRRYSNTRSTARGKRDENMLLSYTVMALAIVILSLPLPLAAIGSTLTKGVAWASCLVSAALTVFTSRRFSSVILVSFVFTFFISSLGDPTAVAIVYGAVISAGIFSAAIAEAKRIHLVFLISAPVIASLLSYVITDSIAVALAPAVVLLPAILLGIGSRRRMCRTHAIALFAAVSIIELLLVVSAYIYSQNGTINAEVIDHAVEYLRGGIEWSFRDAIAQVGAAELNENLLLQIREMSLTMINTLPGTVVMIFLALGFVVQKIAASLFESYDKEELLYAASEPIDASLTTALVFVAAHVLSYTSSPSSAPSFFAVASTNLSLVLLPVLLCIGFRVMGDLPKKIGFFALVAWIGAVLLANVMGESILTVLALIGAFYILFVRTDSWAKDHFAKGEDQ